MEDVFVFHKQKYSLADIDLLAQLLGYRTDVFESGQEYLRVYQGNQIPTLAYTGDKTEPEIISWHETFWEISNFDFISSPMGQDPDFYPAILDYEPNICFLVSFRMSSWPSLRVFLQHWLSRHPGMLALDLEWIDISGNIIHWYGSESIPDVYPE